MSAILQLQRAVDGHGTAYSEFDQIVSGLETELFQGPDTTDLPLDNLVGERYLGDPRRQRQEKLIALGLLPVAAVALTPFITANAVLGGQPIFKGERVMKVGGGPSQDNQAPGDTEMLRMHKLRTMRVDAAERVGDKHAGDDRITTLGRFARRLSIDELTQVENVLRCQMTDNPGEQFGIIGLRPLLGRELFSPIAREAFDTEGSLREFYQDVYNHTPKGITGLAQVMGARVLNTPADFRTYADLAVVYHDIASVRVDRNIIRATVAKLAQPVLGRFGTQTALVNDAM